MAWSKESRHARGYGTRWDKLRVLILQRDKGICHCPDCMGGEKRLKPAREVDHIVSKAEAQKLGWTQEQIDDPSNLRAVNRDCHKKISLIQKGAKPRPQIGKDGWPVQG